MGSTSQINPVALQCPQCGASLPVSEQAYTICRYCGSSLLYSRQDVGSTGAQESLVRGMRLKTYTHTDAQGTGLEMFRMLVPVGWDIQGGCRWLLDNLGESILTEDPSFNPNVYSNLHWESMPLQ